MKTPEISASLKEVSLLFFRLGATSFGGPAAYIALMHHELVVRRKWVNDQRFLDLVGATNLIPGPNATEMAIHLGLIRAGRAGMVAAGLLFCIPGVLATLVVAWVYVSYGSLPEVGWVLYGIKPVVIGIIVQALWNLGRKGLKNFTTITVAGGVVALYLLGFNEIALLFAGAAVVLLAYSGRRFLKRNISALIVVPSLLPLTFSKLIMTVSTFSQAALFLTFLKIGSVLYGSGYVLLAFLKSEFVTRLGWLTNQQVLDAIAAGQITPGPVFSSATFVGYLVGGWQSALLATLGIFLPSFVFVVFLRRVLDMVRKSVWAETFLDGVNASSLGLMAGVSIVLGRSAMIDVFTLVLALVSLFLILRFKVNSIWLILGGGLLGIIYKLVF